MSQILVVTGMHRSGTSMVSSLFQAGGVHIGDKLLAPNDANPRGYFEDVDFLEFHEHLLKERGQHYLYVDPDFRFLPTDAEKSRARKLGEDRAHLAIWGWKDPRTSLFLDFWNEQLPNVRFVFVFRHPLQVLLSLLRRSEFDNRPVLTAGLQAWQTYNASIKSFYDRYPDRCLLVHVDSLTSQIDHFARLVRQKLQLDVQINANMFDRIYRAQELCKSQVPIEATEILTKSNPGLIEFYASLNARADIPADTTRVEVEPSMLLSAVSRFAGSLPESASLTVQQSLLLLLSLSLAPEPTEAMFRRVPQSKPQPAAPIQPASQIARNGIRPLEGFNHVHSSPAQMRMPERVALYSLIFGIQPRNCLEIGTARGGSSAIICGAMDDMGFGKLMCVDPAPAVAPELWSQINHRCSMIVGPSPDALPRAAEESGASFDFALIDGNHNYDGVRADIAGVLPYLSDQAYVLFHDAHYGDVKRAIDEAVSTSEDLTDCGLISVEPTVLKENGNWLTWAGLRLLRFRRSVTPAFHAAPVDTAAATNFELPNVPSVETPPVRTINADSSPAAESRFASVQQHGARIPVVLAGVKCLSGVTTWAERLRAELAEHPRYDVKLLHIGPERPPEYDLFAANVDEAREIVRKLAPAILVPNYVWELYLTDSDADISCLGICHSHSLEEYYLPLSWYESRIAHFIAVSPECAKQLADRLPFRAQDITMLPYGVRVPRELTRDYKNGPLRMIYAGRLTQSQKRVGDFVRLVEHLRQAGVSFAFDIVGDGDELQPLQHAMRQWFPEAQVRFFGRLPHQDVDRMWPDYDVFVQTSDFEGVSVSMLDAMAQGVVPVVTAASSGVAGIIEHERNGFVVPVGNMPAMARAIGRLAADRSLLEAAGQSAHRTSQTYSMDEHCQTFTRVLDQVIQTGRRLDQLKCAGGFGGHHPLYTQLKVIHTQQVELAELRRARPKPKWLQKLSRSIRKRIPGRRNQQIGGGTSVDRKAA